MTAPRQNTWDAPKSTANANSTTMMVHSSASEHPDKSASSVDLQGPTEPREGSTSIRRRGLSIGIKAPFLAGILGVLPVLVVGSLAYRSADNSITERIAQQEIAEADQLSDQLRQYLQERVANVNTVASIVRDSGLLENDVELPEDALESSEDEPEAQVRAAIEQEITLELTDFVQDYRTYSSVAVLNLSGDVLVQSQGAAQELNQQNAIYFQEVLQTGAPVISEPIPIDPNSEDGRLAIYVAAPVVIEGSAQAVISAKIPVDFIGNAILRAASSGEGTVYRLVDSSGQVFQSLPFIPERNQSSQLLAGYLPTFPQVNEQKQSQAWIEETTTGELLSAYAPLQGFSALDWSVVISTDTSLAFLAQRQLLQTILLGSVVTGVAAVLLGAVLARRATEPVTQAAKTVELLGQGKLYARIPVRGRDELAVLGISVNRMAGQIQTLLQTLRQNTEQLEIQNDVLAGLARNEGLIQGDAQAAAQAFSEAIATTLTVHRVSVWLYKPEKEQLECLSTYDQELQTVIAQKLSVIDVPSYFRAISDNQTLAVSDILCHDAAQELAAGEHLAKNTISLLEVPIQSSGNFVGTVRCEHSDTLREWKPQEQTFVSSVANLISLALESEVLQEEVSHLLEVVSEMEDGNLLIQAEVSDRTTGLVADTFNRLVERLVDVLRQVIETARQVSAGANQQKAQAALVASNAEKQAQGVNQVLQLTEQVEEIARDSARQVRITNQSLQIVQSAVEQGQEAIVNLAQGISILQEGSDRIIQQMKTLGEFVGLTDQFVQDQSQIAALTQTLALNASLVAARAAEQRDPRQFVVAAREFSSIANQVSQLAQQTNDSLITLEQRSTQIHSVVSTIDSDVQSLGGLVQGFTQGVEQSNEVFSNVQAGTLEAVEAGETIARSSSEIVGAAQSTADRVRDIADIAAKSAALTQRSSFQAEQIDHLSTELLKTIEFFQLPTTPIPEENSPAAQTLEAVAEVQVSAPTAEVRALAPAVPQNQDSQDQEPDTYIDSSPPINSSLVVEIPGGHTFSN